MPILNVNILNFHGPVSHLEVLLEDTSTEPSRCYVINQWAYPGLTFTALDSESYSSGASSRFTFQIEADPDEIVKGWRTHHAKIDSTASILYNNCADAVQWFLTQYAHIPKPNFYSFPLSLNHLTYGIFIPSCLPIPITLPGRVMDNAKFHIQLRDKRDSAPEKSDLSLKLTIAAEAIGIGLCVVGIIGVAMFMTGGLAAIPIAGAIIVGGLLTHGLFKSSNTLAARHIIHGTQSTPAFSPPIFSH